MPCLLKYGSISRVLFGSPSSSCQNLPLNVEIPMRIIISNEKPLVFDGLNSLKRIKSYLQPIASSLNCRMFQELAEVMSLTHMFPPFFFRGSTKRGLSGCAALSFASLLRVSPLVVFIVNSPINHKGLQGLWVWQTLTEYQFLSCYGITLNGQWPPTLQFAGRRRQRPWKKFFSGSAIWVRRTCSQSPRRGLHSSTTAGPHVDPYDSKHAPLSWKWIEARISAAQLVGEISTLHTRQLLGQKRVIEKSSKIHHLHLYMWTKHATLQM